MGETPLFGDLCYVNRGVKRAELGGFVLPFWGRLIAPKGKKAHWDAETARWSPHPSQRNSETAVFGVNVSKGRGVQSVLAAEC